MPQTDGIDLATTNSVIALMEGREPVGAECREVTRRRSDVIPPLSPVVGPATVAGPTLSAGLPVQDLTVNASVFAVMWTSRV